MKKCISLSALLMLVLLFVTACSEDETCYTCTNAMFAGCELDICDSEITTNGSCGGSNFTADGDNEQIKDAYEANGWTCQAQ